MKLILKVTLFNIMIGVLSFGTIAMGQDGNTLQKNDTVNDTDQGDATSKEDVITKKNDNSTEVEASNETTDSDEKTSPQAVEKLHKNTDESKPVAKEASAETGKDQVAKVSTNNKPKKKKSKVAFKVTDTFITEYVGDNGANPDENIHGSDDTFWNFRNQAIIQARSKYFDSSIQMDLTMFHNPPGLVSSSEFAIHEDFIGSGASGYTLLNYENDFRIERAHVTARLKRLRITAGDFSVTFGRGMALSLIKLDDAGSNNALRGGRVILKIPRKFKFILLGGVTNTLNMDPIARTIQEDDPYDEIVGTRFELELLDAINIGAHGVFMKPKYTLHDEITTPERMWVDQGPGIAVMTGGLSFDLHAGGVSLYLEGNAQQHDNYRVLENYQPVLNESGFAGYAELVYDLSPLVLKAEGIYYKQWLMEGAYRGYFHGLTGAPAQYHHMPTLELMWMTINSLGNETGGRYSADWYIKKSDTQLAFTTATIKYHGGVTPNGGKWDDHSSVFIVHPVLKIRQNFKNTGIMLALEGGFRYETTDNETLHSDNGRLWHAMADLSLPIAGTHSIELKSELRRHDLNISESIPHWINMNTVGYDKAGLWGISILHEYSDENPEPLDSVIGNWTLPFPDGHYFSTMINFHPSFWDGLSLRFQGGSVRGGFKCAGGVCRQYPDMVGGKLEVSYRF